MDYSYWYDPFHLFFPMSIYWCSLCGHFFLFFPSLVMAVWVVIFTFYCSQPTYSSHSIVTCPFTISLQGFNAALTEPRGKNQKEKSELPEEGLSPKLDTKLKLHPDLKEPLNMLCQDPNTTIVVLSGSDKNLLEEVRHLYPALALYP